jgi:hypothetical protein
MIAFKPNTAKLAPEGAARPVTSAEQWLGRNASEKRRLWERLNPRHRKQLQLVARALVMRQTRGRLPEELRLRLTALLERFDQLTACLEPLVDAALQKPGRTPHPGGPSR